MAFLCACSFVPVGDPVETSLPVSSSVSYTKIAEPLEDFSRTSPTDFVGEAGALLSAPEQELYEQMASHALLISSAQDPDLERYPLKRIQIEQALSDAEISRTFEAFINDFPQYFWISAHYQFGTTEKSTVIQLYSEISPEVCTEKIKELEKEVSEILDGMDVSLSDLQRELFLYRAILERCVYDDTSPDWESYTLYGALVDGSAVCEGYARAVQQLFRLAGIPCRVVSGTAEGELHMWNLVEIGGEWYHLDATWGDSSPLSTYFYFNLTDEAIRWDHTISTEGLPPCESEEANYFCTFAIPVSGFSGFSLDSLSDGIAACLSRGDSILLFRVDETLDFDEAVDRLLKPEGNLLSDALADATIKTDPSLTYTTFTYSLAPQIRGIAVCLE